MTNNRMFSFFRPQLRSLSIGLLALLPVAAAAAPEDSQGLWVGRAVLSEVNEVVSAVNADDVREQTPPGETTPTSDQAEILLILHVDETNGDVRLLKSVAIVDADADAQGVDVKLFTDPQLFTNHTLARRIAAAAFEFGDPNSRTVVGSVATAAANAAAASPTDLVTAQADALTAAEDAVEDEVDLANGGTTYSASLNEFIKSDDFGASPTTAAAAAAKAAGDSYAEGLRGQELEDAVRSEVLIEFQTLSRMADGATLNEVPMTGFLVAEDTLECDIFLGAFHPFNPFRHRQHPTHRGGFDIKRHITLTVSSAGGGEEFDTTDRGLDRLTGVYEENIFGLHKPLGQAGEHGLRTKGGFVLDRISRVGTLNPAN